MIFKRLEIVLATGANGRGELIVRFQDEHKEYARHQMLAENHLVSLFDHVFDLAKYEIKEALEKEPRP